MTDRIELMYQAYRAIRRAAASGGFSLLRVHFSLRSWYLDLEHASRGFVQVRISDHPSGHFIPSGRKVQVIIPARLQLSRVVAFLAGRSACLEKSRQERHFSLARSKYGVLTS